jgi:hypothetical protein
MRNASDAITWLYHDAAELCRRFAEINDQIRQIDEGDPRASDLKCQLESLRTRILRLYGILGVFFPDNVSPILAKLISPDGISSSEYRRKHLSLEEVFGTLADGLGRKPGRADFSEFVNHLGIHELSNTSKVRDVDVRQLIATWPEQTARG